MQKEKGFKAILSVITSKRDIYGNRYGLLTITNTETGESGKALIDSIGNEDYFLQQIGFIWKNTYKTSQEVPIREFNRLAKGLPYDYKPVICQVLKKSLKAYEAKRKKEDEKRQKHMEYINALRIAKEEKDKSGFKIEPLKPVKGWKGSKGNFVLTLNGYVMQVFEGKNAEQEAKDYINALIS